MWCEREGGRVGESHEGDGRVDGAGWERGDDDVELLLRQRRPVDVGDGDGVRLRVRIR